MFTSDEKLARETIDDPQKFNPLVKRYTDRVHRYIARLIGNWQESEDLTQDVFLKAFKNIASFNPRLKFSSWLYRIAHNESVNYIKKKYRYKEVEFSDEIKKELYDNKTVLEKIIQREEAETVAKTLLKLKPRDREILELYYFEEKSYLEISDILHLSVNSIGPTIKRAKQKLKKQIKNEQIRR
jgi:RNA polymerase sigma-70 factor (ECF subfamily)